MCTWQQGQVQTVTAVTSKIERRTQRWAVSKAQKDDGSNGNVFVIRLHVRYIPCSVCSWSHNATVSSSGRPTRLHGCHHR
jgi:hypothetical protein